METNFFSKKSVATLLAFAVISTATLQPKRTEAALLISPFADTVAAYVFAGAWVTGAGSIFVASRTNSYKVRENALTIFFNALIFGMVLDDSGQQKVVLKPIGSKLAAQAGVTSEEQECYNHELDVIQATFDDISAQIAPLKESERSAASRKLWNEYRSAISPAAFSAFEKIIAQSLR